MNLTERTMRKAIKLIPSTPISTPSELLDALKSVAAEYPNAQMRVGVTFSGKIKEIRIDSQAVFDAIKGDANDRGR